MVHTQGKKSARKRYHPSATLSAIHFTRTGLHSPCFFVTPDFMKQSPSWEANRLSARQKIPRILWKPKIHYSIHKSPTTRPYSEPDQSSPCARPTSWRSSSVWSSHLGLGLPNDLCPSGFSTKTL